MRGYPETFHISPKDAFRTSGADDGKPCVRAAPQNAGENPQEPKRIFLRFESSKIDGIENRSAGVVKRRLSETGDVYNVGQIFAFIAQGIDERELCHRRAAYPKNLRGPPCRCAIKPCPKAFLSHAGMVDMNRGEDFVPPGKQRADHGCPYVMRVKDVCPIGGGRFFQSFRRQPFQRVKGDFRAASADATSPFGLAYAIWISGSSRKLSMISATTCSAPKKRLLAKT